MGAWDIQHDQDEHGRDRQTLVPSETHRLKAENARLRKACDYCLDMLLQDCGGETVESRIGMVGGHYAVTLLREALAESVEDPTAATAITPTE